MRYAEMKQSPVVSARLDGNTESSLWALKEKLKLSTSQIIQLAIRKLWEQEWANLTNTQVEQK